MIKRGKPKMWLLGLGYCEKHNIQFPLTIDGCPACKSETTKPFINIGLKIEYEKMLKDDTN